MSESNVYLNGEIVPGERAVISVFDTGFLHGASVFTTMLAHNGKVFRLGRHLTRLSDNACRIGLTHTATGSELTAAVGDVLEANGLAEARVRITLSAGAVGAAAQPTTVVTAVSFKNEQRWYEQGIRVIVNSVRQYEGDPIAGVKTGCYLTRILARQAAAAVGADEALWFTTSGRLAETCFCNVFLVRDGKVWTPSLATPVLAGVVREAAIELCERDGIAIQADEVIGGEEVPKAQEVFVTSSVAGIRPVVRIQDQPVGDGAPGPITRRIMAAYADLLEAECPPT